MNPKSCIDSSFSLEKEDFNDAQEDSVEDEKKETPVFPKIGRKHKNKQVVDDADVDLENQSRKKSRKSGSNLERTIQKWLEQQEARQVELDRKREEKDKREQEQKAELLRMKYQSDMMLFGILNKLTSNLNSSRNDNSPINQTSQGKLFYFF